MMLQMLSKDEIIKKYLELEKENEELRKQKEALEKELRKYKNANTPPSAYSHLKPSVASCASKKRGAPAGHPGNNRPWIPDAVTYHIIADECPNCHCKDLNVIRTARQQIDEVPQEIKPKTTTVERDF